MSGLPENTVAKKAIETIDLEDFFPSRAQVTGFDLKDLLFKGLVLKEKDFRSAVRTTDWSAHADQVVHLYCSTDAIVPMWAYMLLTAQIESAGGRAVVADSAGAAMEQVAVEAIQAMDTAPYEGKRILVKGCGDLAKSSAVYVAITRRLGPIVRSLAYGEACSSVPIHKNPR